MSMNETIKIWVNRVIAFLAGTLLIFIIMQVSIVSTERDLNAKLMRELDAIRYEPGRLLAQGKDFFSKKDYENAKRVLTDLTLEHPTSTEAAESKTLYAAIEKQQLAMDEKWAAIEPGIRQTWEKETTQEWRDELKLQFEKDSTKLENELEKNLQWEWHKVKDKLRKDWERDS